MEVVKSSNTASLALAPISPSSSSLESTASNLALNSTFNFSSIAPLVSATGLTIKPPFCLRAPCIFSTSSSLLVRILICFSIFSVPVTITSLKGPRIKLLSTGLYFIASRSSSEASLSSKFLALSKCSLPPISLIPLQAITWPVLVFTRIPPPFVVKLPETSSASFTALLRFSTTIS